MFKLHTSLITAGLLAAFAGSAFAAEGEQPSTWMTPSTKSRAEVRAEVEAAAKSGKLAAGEASYTIAPSSNGSSVSRAQIAAETREAVRLGLLPKHDSTRATTSADLEQIRQAGLRAVESQTAATK